jgi:hypothetical protein
MSPITLIALGDALEASLRRNCRPLDKTINNVKNILALEGDAIV